MKLILFLLLLCAVQACGHRDAELDKANKNVLYITKKCDTLGLMLDSCESYAMQLIKMVRVDMHKIDSLQKELNKCKSQPKRIENAENVYIN